ncbi:hypothetical protein TNCV_3635741 [Trichonephila clavipes]|nr:hypothetical protein TNCV_3635741 [Trichonephila clavipes]
MNKSDSDLSDEDYDEDKTYEPHAYWKENQVHTNESDDEKHGNICNRKTILDHHLPLKSHEPIYFNIKVVLTQRLRKILLLKFDSHAASILKRNLKLGLKDDRAEHSVQKYEISNETGRIQGEKEISLAYFRKNTYLAGFHMKFRGKGREEGDIKAHTEEGTGGGQKKKVKRRGVKSS